MTPKLFIHRDKNKAKQKTDNNINSLVHGEIVGISPLEKECDGKMLYTITVTLPCDDTED